MENIQLIEKYRPRKLDDMLLESNTKNMLRNFLNKKDIPNILLYGTPGIGKTSLAKLLVDELDCTHLYVNASLDNSVEIIRDRVKDFCDTNSIDGKIKLTLLDECDSLSSNTNGSSAQSALRNIIDVSTNCRFIMTCNYLDKIIAPIQSRCSVVRIEFSLRDAVGRIIHILNEEKIKYDKDELKKFVEEVIVKKFPDLRLIINILEQCIIDGTLKVEYKETKEIFNTIFGMINSSKFNLKEFRQFTLDNQNSFGKDYISLCNYIFSKTEDPSSLLIIAEHLYRMSIVVDKEIELIAMAIELQKLKKG